MRMPDCNLPLTAVNAGKTEFIRRPHFRHPDGAAKSECMYRAARLAALQLLLDQGVFQLPRRSMPGQVTGLSGFEHQAWVEQPPERVRIREYSFFDRVAAVLTLDDGRQLRVQLVGSKTSATSSDLSFATIFLDVDESVASMTPAKVAMQSCSRKQSANDSSFCFWLCMHKNSMLPFSERFKTTYRIRRVINDDLISQAS